MSKLKLWAGLVLAVLVVGGGLYGWWALDLRWRPHTIKRHQAEITQLLKTAGWVSPGRQGPVLYMISYRSCEDCIRYEAWEFPKLAKAKVDTRVIMIARRDFNGISKSTPAERATVAELWVNRGWPLHEAWAKARPAAAWTAPGIIPADNDTARAAVVEQSRLLVDQLTPLLKDNGIRFAYPTLIWWTKDGVMRGCACESLHTYARVRRELGA
jgi:hypothetical protein